MRTLVFGLALLFAAGAALAAQTGNKTPDEFDQKQKAIRDEIDRLQKRLDDLRKAQKELAESKQAQQAKLEAQRKERERQAKLEAERKAKEEAEKKKHFAKVEIRGKLVNGAFGQWQVSINELTWNLNFADKKELAASAQKLIGKGVVITGVVVNKKASNQLGLPGGFPIQPGWPNPNQIWPNPYPGWPSPNPGWNPYYPQLETPVTITVESIVLAKDL